MLKTIVSSFCLYFMLSLSHEAQSIDRNAEPHYRKFLRYAKECQVKVLPIKFRIELGDINRPGIVGICMPGKSVITLQESRWGTLEKHKQEQLLFHELSHCLLGQLKHDDNGLNIMNTENFIEKDIYTHYYDYFIRRLFVNCKKPLNTKFEYKETK